MSILAGVEEATLAPLCRAERGGARDAEPARRDRQGRGGAPFLQRTKRARRGDRLDATLGHVEWIADEARFDDVTALAGCGRASLFRFADAWRRRGRRWGCRGSGGAAGAGDAGGRRSHGGGRRRAARDAGRSRGESGRIDAAGVNVLDRADGLVALLTDTLAASARRNREITAETR